MKYHHIPRGMSLRAPSHLLRLPLTAARLGAIVWVLYRGLSSSDDDASLDSSDSSTDEHDDDDSSEPPQRLPPQSRSTFLPERVSPYRLHVHELRLLSESEDSDSGDDRSEDRELIVEPTDDGGEILRGILYKDACSSLSARSSIPGDML